MFVTVTAGAVKAHELRTFGKGELTAQLSELRTELQAVSTLPQVRDYVGCRLGLDTVHVWKVR